MALYAIGDIHGCLNALKTVFKHQKITEEDQVVFLGDYIDRGPESKGVIDWLLTNSSDYNFIFLQGNHEIMMLEARFSREKLMYWLRFGGVETLDSYQIGDDPRWVNKVDQKHWEFMKNCQPYFETDQYIFVHAGLESGIPLNQQDTHHLFWRKFITPEMYTAERKVICGHTSRKNGEVADFGHTICIDTYAYGGQWLTCLNVETNEYLQANDLGEMRKK